MPRALTLALLFGLAARLSAFSPDVPEPHWTITGPPVDVHPGVPFEVTARVTVPDGYYQDSGSDFLIFEPAAPAKVSARSHSAPSDRAGKPSFTKTFTLRRTVTVPAGTPAGTVSLGFSLGWQICQLDGVCLLPVQRTALVPLSVAADAATGSLFWAFLAAAFAGGLLLNLMPCVFPVLALKLVALASAADQTRRRGEAVAFAAGTFATVFGLGLLTGGAAALGQRLDWGFTFQSPVFVAALGLLFWAFALQLVGLWTWSWSPFRLTGATRPGWGSREQTRAFFGGAILVLATAPCTAPLLGPALGFAFAQPPLVILLFFGVAGVGLATPLIVLSWMPSWSRVVPKPGPWMVVFERVAGVVLAATVVYLLWIFTRLTRDDWVWPGFAVLVLAAGALGVPRQWKPGRRRWIRGALVVLAGVTLATAAYFPGTAAVPILPDGWVRFSQATLDGALVQGKSVLVDATADWCATCQVNEAAVLLRPDVSALLKGYGVVRLRADYTRPDPEIQKWLASVGRAGLPVYVLYRPGRQVYFFPEVLTDDTFTRVMEAQTPMSPSSCLPASRACSRPMAD